MSERLVRCLWCRWFRYFGVHNGHGICGYPVPLPLMEIVRGQGNLTMNAKRLHHCATFERKEPPPNA